MAELLDIYDENENHIGQEERKIVHEKALWHKTVHCWLYDKEGNVYFQRRKEEGTLYTTASGHILAGESVKEGFGREINEEIGIPVDYEKAQLVEVVKFILDRENKDGSYFRDRAFANVYVCLYEGSDSSFDYDENELSALVKVNAKEALELFEKEEGKINGTVITRIDNKMDISKQEIDFNDFLVNKGETALQKYGAVLSKVVSLHDKED